MRQLHYNQSVTPNRQRKKGKGKNNPKASGELMVMLMLLKSMSEYVSDTTLVNDIIAALQYVLYQYQMFGT